MSFTVNDSLLSKRYVDTKLNLVFSPPKGFNEVEKSISNTKLLDSLSGLKLEHKKVFFNKDDTALIVVSKVNETLAVKQLVKKNRSYIDKKWNKPIFSEFYSNAIRFNQFILLDDKYVVFKLMIKPNKELVEINYIIPKNNYDEAFAKRIESSLGTINRVNI